MRLLDFPAFLKVKYVFAISLFDRKSKPPIVEILENEMTRVQMIMIIIKTNTHTALTLCQTFF